MLNYNQIDTNKIWMDYYCLGKNHASETLCSKFIRCQNPYQLQNFIFFNSSGAQKPTWAKFLEFEFFLAEKARLYRYHQNKNQLEVTLSYNESVDKIIFTSLIIGQTGILHLWGSSSSLFLHITFHIFLNLTTTEKIKSKKLFSKVISEIL